MAQWGRCGTNRTVAFPIAYSSACYAITSAYNNSGDHTTNTDIQSITNTTFKAYKGYGILYISVGS